MAKFEVWTWHLPSLSLDSGPVSRMRMRVPRPELRSSSVPSMSYYHYQQYQHANDMSYYTPHTQVQPMPSRACLHCISYSRICLHTLLLLLLLLLLQDMSSYVAVQGTPRKDSSFVFGLTPKEVRYLRVREEHFRLNVSDSDATYLFSQKMRNYKINKRQN